MVLTVNIYYKGINGSAKAFVKEMTESGTADKIRAEEGNLKYNYFYPADDGETVLLIDSWENREALDIHHNSEMMKEIIRLREKYALTMIVEKYVTDEGGITENDKKFIK